MNTGDEQRREFKRNPKLRLMEIVEAQGKRTVAHLGRKVTAEELDADIQKARQEYRDQKHAE